MTLVDSRKRYTAVVVATGDVAATGAHRPQDATTNPSLPGQAVRMPEYWHLLKDHAWRGAFTNLN